MGKLILSILCALVVVFAIPAGVFAAETAETEVLPDPGITPDSPFYFMDKWGKQIAMTFTFGPENKAQKAVQYAGERMAEIEAMLERKKFKQAAEAGKEYQYCIRTMAQNMEQAKSKGLNVEENIALTAERHLEIANKISENAAQEVQQIMTQTREQARTCQETALRNMAQSDPEKAARLNLQLMERQLNRIRVQTENPETDGLQSRLEEYKRLGKLGEEISGIAKGLGKDHNVDYLVGQATEHHLEVLAQVQQRVQGNASEAVGEAIQNCIRNHEQLVSRMQAQNRIGSVPEETSAQDAFRDRVEQSTQSMTQSSMQTQTGQGSSDAGTHNTTQTQTQTGQRTPQSTGSDSTGASGNQGIQGTSGPESASTTGGQGGSDGISQKGS